MSFVVTEISTYNADTLIKYALYNCGDEISKDILKEINLNQCTFKCNNISNIDNLLVVTNIYIVEKSWYQYLFTPENMREKLYELAKMQVSQKYFEKFKNSSYLPSNLYKNISYENLINNREMLFELIDLIDFYNDT